MSAENGNSQQENKDKDDATDGFLKEIFQNFDRYATKKSIAQGFLDIALLCANIAQLKEIVKREKDTIYYVAVTFISISVTLQILAGGCIVAVGRMQYKPKTKTREIQVEKLNDVTTILLFLISTVNVVISLVWVFTGEDFLLRKCS